MTGVKDLFNNLQLQGVQDLSTVKIETGSALEELIESFISLRHIVMGQDKFNTYYEYAAQLKKPYLAKDITGFVRIANIIQKSTLISDSFKNYYSATLDLFLNALINTSPDSTHTIYSPIKLSYGFMNTNKDIIVYGDAIDVGCEMTGGSVRVYGSAGSPAPKGGKVHVTGSAAVAITQESAELIIEGSVTHCLAVCGGVMNIGGDLPPSPESSDDPPTIVLEKGKLYHKGKIIFDK